MLYAIHNNEKIEATPKTKAICSLCERQVFSKCGEVNVWHWAHLKEESCDGWYEPETAWHKDWKLQFGKELSEIIIEKNGVKHIADIFTKSKVVIELQNSPLLKPVIRKRENFYGERMLWVINGNPFKSNFSIGSTNMVLNSSNYGYVRGNLMDKRTGENVIINKSKKEESFNWKWCRKSWNEATRPVFIDFGEKDLFWVLRGMGTDCGVGKYVSKELFVKKYLS